MPHSMLWERLQVFVSLLDNSPPPSAAKAVLSTAASVVVDAQPTASRMRALEQALLAANASLSDERARRAKWERRAIVSTAEQNSQRDELAARVSELKELEKKASRFETLADDNARARRVAEEQRDVALKRLADAVDACEIEEVRRENNLLEARVMMTEKERDEVRDRLEGEKAALKVEMGEIREAVRIERERFVEELAVRTSSFAELERELKDARETYIIAANKFETQRESLGKKVEDLEEERNVLVEEVGEVKRLTGEKEARLAHFMQRCQLLEMENEELKKKNSEQKNVSVEVVTESNKGDTEPSAEVVALRTHLAKVEAHRDGLQKQVECMKMEREGSERDGSERLSSSSMSTESSYDSVAKRVQELEISLEVEARESETLRQQLDNMKETAKAKEDEASQLRGEMAAIHSRMRHMARVSLPSGAEDLLEDDEDAKKLKQLRETTRKDEKRGFMAGITPATMSRIQRKVRLSGENKNRFRA